MQRKPCVGITRSSLAKTTPFSLCGHTVRGSSPQTGGEEEKQARAKTCCPVRPESDAAKRVFSQASSSSGSWLAIAKGPSHEVPTMAE